MTVQTTLFTIGTQVRCSDGVCGELTGVVVDPLARTLTHLIVDPRFSRTAGHLVPIEVVESTADQIQLRCSIVEFGAFPAAESTEFLPGLNEEWGYQHGQVLTWPYYGLGVGMSLASVSAAGPGRMSAGTRQVTHDRVPKGEVEVRRGEPVHATDGTIGHVEGLVVDTSDHHVTHVLLAEGHLWGRKTVAIPISAVTGVSDGVQITLTKDEIGDLPPVDLDFSHA